MKNRIIILAMTALAAIGMISCGNSNPADPDNSNTAEVTEVENGSGSNTNAVTFKLTADNVDNYIVNIANYEGREVALEREGLDEETVDYYSEYLFANQSYNIPDWVAGEGDTVIIDYVGKMDGVAFEGGTAQNKELLLGSHSYIEGFEEGLLGTKAGETVDLNLAFPDPYPNNPDYSGKECVFTVTVNYIFPALSDESVKALNNPAFTTKNEFREYVREMLSELERQQYEQDLIQMLINMVVEESEFPEFSEELLNAEKESIISNAQEQADAYGTTVEALLLASGTTLEDEAIASAKEHIVFVKIAKDKNLTVSETEVDDRINEFIELYDDVTSAEDVYATIASRELLTESIMISKVYDYLLGVTTVAAPTV